MDYDDIDTYAEDRWGAWLDDTRVEYRPPHTSHDTASDYTLSDWREEVGYGNEFRGYEEWAEAMAEYNCPDCKAYAEAWREEQAERRVGA